MPTHKTGRGYTYPDGQEVPDLGLWLQRLASDIDKDTTALAALVPAGVILPYGGAAAPPGFLLCDGKAYATSKYPALSKVLAGKYGAPDASTFQVPDMRGRTPVGLNATEAEFKAMGQAGGSKTHTLSVAQMPVHTHTQNAHGHGVTQKPHSHGVNGTVHDGAGQGYAHVLGGNAWLFQNLVQATAAPASISLTVNNATATNQNTGGGQAHPILQPYLTVQFIIKY